jgi:hypothetical protein
VLTSRVSEDEKNRSITALLIYAAELWRPTPPRGPELAPPRDVEPPAVNDVPETPAAPPAPDGAAESVEDSDVPLDDAGVVDAAEPLSSTRMEQAVVSASGPEPDAEVTSSSEPDASTLPPQAIYVLPFYVFPQLPQRPGR